MESYEKLFWGRGGGGGGDGRLIASEKLIKIYLLEPIQKIFGTNSINKE